MATFDFILKSLMKTLHEKGRLLTGISQYSCARAAYLSQPMNLILPRRKQVIRHNTKFPLPKLRELLGFAESKGIFSFASTMALLDECSLGCSRSIGYFGSRRTLILLALATWSTIRPFSLNRHFSSERTNAWSFSLPFCSSFCGAVQYKPAETLDGFHGSFQRMFNW
jgi:hypothetical protein